MTLLYKLRPYFINYDHTLINYDPNHTHVVNHVVNTCLSRDLSHKHMAAVANYCLLLCLFTPIFTTMANGNELVQALTTIAGALTRSPLMQSPQNQPFSPSHPRTPPIQQVVLPRPAGIPESTMIILCK